MSPVRNITQLPTPRNQCHRCAAGDRKNPSWEAHSRLLALLLSTVRISLCVFIFFICMDTWVNDGLSGISSRDRVRSILPHPIIGCTPANFVPCLESARRVSHLGNLWGTWRTWGNKQMLFIFVLSHSSFPTFHFGDAQLPITDFVMSHFSFQTTHCWGYCK